ncbi:hypothetical protein BCU71_07680 [Vibrio lentus]|uniref:hypothetical protein n=1 Tax=Vibrio lentus TaxID=136468 RepID=UPI000C821445|nr:hypothetical protein [Vibrio lentus]PMH28435.1 hypothetical protein BCU71_07680 [Vibrio lentus]PMK70416.1 hypothetical protein BCT93_07315 [Vibrio lentus]
MGGSSKSSNQTNNTTNTSNKNTSNAFNADQNGTVISGVEHSNITVTDGGAVKAALAAMTDASENITKNSQYAIAHNGEVSKYAIAHNGEMGKYAIAHNSEVSKVAISQSTDLAKALGTHALVNAQSTSKDAMDIMKNLSLQSDAGTAQQMTKYFMFGAVALSVAVALKGKF